MRAARRLLTWIAVTLALLTSGCSSVAAVAAARPATRWQPFELQARVIDKGPVITPARPGVPESAALVVFVRVGTCDLHGTVNASFYGAVDRGTCVAASGEIRDRCDMEHVRHLHLTTPCKPAPRPQGTST